MRLEISLSGMVIGVIEHVEPGANVALALRLLEDEQPASAEERACPPGSPCACESGRPFEACHGGAS